MNGKKAKRLRKYVDGCKHIFGDVAVAYQETEKSQFFLGQKKMVEKCFRKYYKYVKRQMGRQFMHECRVATYREFY